MGTTNSEADRAAKEQKKLNPFDEKNLVLLDCFFIRRQMMSSHFHPDMDGSSDIHLKSNMDHNSDMMLMETSNEVNDVNDLKSSMNIIELNSTMNSMMDDLDTEPINPPIDTTSPKINL